MLLEIATPDGRAIRQHHESLAHAKAALQDGYQVTGQVFGADKFNGGGLVGSIGPGNGPSIMAALLDAYGDELEDWLTERGVVTSLTGQEVRRFKEHLREKRGNGEIR